MRVALNVADLTRHERIMPLLVGPVVPNRVIVDAEPGLDGAALVLECDDRRARCIAQVLRDHDDGVGQYRTRVYLEGPKGGWKRVLAIASVITAKELKEDR